MTICADQDPTITITLSTGAEPLVIGPDCVDTGIWWNALSLPAWAMRYEYAPPSQFLPGQMLLSAIPEAGAVTVAVVARGADLDAVETQKALLASVLAQWRYTITVAATPDGGSPTVLGDTYDAKPTIPIWGQPVDTAEAGMLVAVGTASIPVNPPGSP